MGVFQVIRSAVFDPNFYAGLRERTWTEGAKYFAVVAFIIVFAYVVPVWAFVLQAKPELVDTVTAMYPDTLEVTVADGAMHINQPEPFVIPNTFTKELPENIVVFDTQNDDFSSDALAEAKTLVLFKKSFAVMQNTDGVSGRGMEEQRVFSYGTSSATSTLTKADILSVAEKVKPYVRPVAIVGGAFLFILAILLGGLGMLVFHLLYVFLPALLIFAYYKLRKQNDTYRTAYVTALFASIPVSMLSAVLGFFGGLPPFTYTLVLMIVVIVNLSRIKPTVPESAPLA